MPRPKKDAAIEARRAHENDGVHYPTSSTRSTVDLLSALGWRQENICRALSISQDTLVKHYRAELDNGGTTLAASFINTGMMKALGMQPDSMVPDVNKMDVSMWKFLAERKFDFAPKAVSLNGAIAVYDTTDTGHVERLGLRIAGLIERVRSQQDIIDP